MMKAALLESSFSLVEHVLTVIDTHDPCVFHPAIFLAGEDACTDRHVEQITLEVVRDIVKYPAGNLIVVAAAPEDVHIEPAPPCVARKHIIIDVPALFV
jgi:hypothetical protein